MCVRLSVRARCVSVQYEKSSVVHYSSMHKEEEAEKAEQHARQKKGGSDEAALIPHVRKQSSQLLYQHNMHLIYSPSQGPPCCNSTVLWREQQESERQRETGTTV